MSKIDAARKALEDINTSHLTTAQVAEALNLTRAGICQAVKDERLQATRLGTGRGFYIFSIPQILRAIESGNLNPKIGGHNGNGHRQ